MIAFRLCGGESHGMGRLRFLKRGSSSLRMRESAGLPLVAGTGSERADFFVRPLLVMDWSNRLPVGIGNEDFEVEGSRNGLIADHAGGEAVLAYSSEDTCVHTRAGRLHDFKIGGLTGLIDNHADNDLAVIVQQASGAGRICYDIDFVDQLGSDDSG